jgi:hypothetical protein
MQLHASTRQKINRALSPLRFLPGGLLFALILGGARAEQPASVTPLLAAHAHNDYEHARPLFDALAHGFCSVEADVYLVGDQLIVAHTPAGLKPQRTLEKLYLDPLRARIRANEGRVYRGGPPIYLLVDIKTDARKTYAVLDRVLAQYAEMLSTTRDGMFEQKAVTVVVSGNRPRREMATQKVRYAGYDGRLSDLDSTESAHFLPWISDRWSSHFSWKGEGALPERERMKLHEIVKKAHARGRKVRFWDTADKPALWQALRAAGVDLINTDQLEALQRFLGAEAAEQKR